MGKFIEEFYYGNLDLQARSTKENKAVQKQMEDLMLNEDFLTKNLSGESKKKFEYFYAPFSSLYIRYVYIKWYSHDFPLQRNKGGGGFYSVTALIYTVILRCRSNIAVGIH